jgi:hypothetical protein
VHWGTRSLTLTAASGLRHGRNVLRVLAHDRSARGEAERHVFTVRKRGAIPGVRAQARPWVRKWTRLDAGASRPSSRDRRLSYRWRLMRRPHGSHARIRAAHKRVARLRPDRPGRYVARLTVTERRRPDRGRGGSVRAAAAQAMAGAVSTTLNVPLSAQPPISPYGVSFDADPTVGLNVGGTSYPMTSSAAGSLTAFVLDRRNPMAAPTSTLINPINGAFDLQGLTTYLKGLSSDNLGDMLVVLMGGRGAAKNPAYQPGNNSRINALTQALTGTGKSGGIGFTQPDASDAVTALAAGNAFTIAGIPGGEPGSAARNMLGSSKGAGQIHGFLRPTTTGDGTVLLEQPDFRRFEFHDNGDDGLSAIATGMNPNPGDAATITLGQLPPYQNDNIEVSVFDAVTLDPIQTVAISVPFSEAGAPPPNTLDPINKVLQTYRNNPSVLVLFMMRGNSSTGFPVQAHESTRVDLSQISQALASMGANRDVFIRSLAFSTDPYDFNQQPGTGNNYFFLGGAGMQPVEGTPVVTVPAQGMSGGVSLGSTNMTGLLQRDDQGRWVPTRASANDALSHDLESLANGAPTSYGYPGSPDEVQQYQAVEQYFYTELIKSPNVLCDPSASSDCSTVPNVVRGNYSQIGFLNALANGGEGSDPNTPWGALRCPTGGDLPRGATFTQDQLENLAKQICGEFHQLGTVGKALFLQMNKVAADVKDNSVINLLATESSFLGFLTHEQSDQLSQKSRFLGISGEAADVAGALIEDALKFTSALLAPETGGASELGGGGITELLSLSSGVLGLSGEAVDAQDQDPAWKVEVTAGQLYKQVQDAYGLAVDRNEWLWRLIASDPNKLAQVYSRVAGTQPGGQDWNLTRTVNVGTHQAVDQVKFQYEVAALRYQTARLVGSVVKTCDTGGSSSDPMSYNAFTQLKEFNQITHPNSNYLTNGQHQLESYKLSSADQQQFAPNVFGSPFVPGTDVLATGPQSAWVAKSPFLMVQIPASQQVYKNGASNECSELMHP